MRFWFKKKEKVFCYDCVHERTIRNGSTLCIKSPLSYSERTFSFCEYANEYGRCKMYECKPSTGHLSVIEEISYD